MKNLKTIGLVLLIVMALVWVQRSLHPKPADEEALPAYGVGQVLAEQAADAIHDKGRVMVICLPVPSVRMEAQWDGFRHTLAQHKNIQLAGTNAFKPSETSLGQISFSQLAAIMDAHSNVDVIVSFLGVTSFTEAQIASLPKPASKLVVMDWNPQDVQRGMEAGLVKAAVMARRLTPPPTEHPKTPRQWFDRYYDLVTPGSSGNP